MEQDAQRETEKLRSGWGGSFGGGELLAAELMENLGFILYDVTGSVEVINMDEKQKYEHLQQVNLAIA